MDALEPDAGALTGADGCSLCTVALSEEEVSSTFSFASSFVASFAFSFFSFGVAEYVLQGGLIFLLCPFVGRFKKKFLLSFGTAVFYGVVLDFWRMLFGTEVPNELWQRAFFCGLGGCITAFAIALLLRTYLPQQGYELVVKELSDRYGWAMDRVKWIYDMSSLVVAILLMLLLFGEFSFSMIGSMEYLHGYFASFSSSSSSGSMCRENVLMNSPASTSVSNLNVYSLHLFAIVSLHTLVIFSSSFQSLFLS